MLGAVQGPAELLPGLELRATSSLVPAMLGWRYRELDPELRKSFEVALHAGGALALLIGLRKEVAEYLRSFGPRNLVTLGALVRAGGGRSPLRFERPIERRLSRARAGRDRAAGRLGRDGGRRRAPRATAGATTRASRDALVIGFAQAFALAPGVSRNGATLDGRALARLPARRRERDLAPDRACR